MKIEFPARTSSITRRQFLYYSALAAGATALPSYAKPTPRKLGAGEKLRIAAVGGGGKGAEDLECCLTEHIVAIADVDESMAAKYMSRFPKAKFYLDCR